MIIKRELLGGSSKGSRWGGGHQQGAVREEVKKRELMGRWSSEGSFWGGGHQNGAGGEVIVRRELVGRWSSKGS